MPVFVVSPQRLYEREEHCEQDDHIFHSLMFKFLWQAQKTVDQTCCNDKI